MLCVLAQVADCPPNNLSKKWTAAHFNYWAWVVGFCQAQTHKPYFIIYTCLSVHLQFSYAEVIFYIFGTGTSKSFTLINNYCKYQIPEILYFSTDGHKVLSFCQALGQHTTLNRTCEIAFD